MYLGRKIMVQTIKHINKYLQSFSNLKKIVRHKRLGMTLIEIMLVFTIVAGILVGVIQLAKTLQSRQKVNNTKTLIRTVSSGVETFKIDLGRFPTKLDELVNPPADSNERRRWQGPYVAQEMIKEGAIRDDWGTELEYKFDGAKNNFEVFSWGKDGQGSEVGNIFAD
jgi:general secretion pathway protein G